MEQTRATPSHTTGAGRRRVARSRLHIWSSPLIAALFFSWFSAVISAAAAEHDRGPVLVFMEENDFVNETDRWYTQGARITFYQADNDLPRWTAALLDRVPALGFEPGANRIGYGIGQSMFTPADTHSPELQRNDRPYAGWLYATLALQRRGPGPGDSLSLENFQLELGVLGPNSFSDHMQTWYHGDAPHGWDHQLKNEPGIAVKYGRAWLVPVPSRERRHADLVPHAGFSAGNADTSLRAGATLRAGWKLPDDFGAQPIESVIAAPAGWLPSQQRPRWGFYLFSGIEGRAVLYNAFLDGNAFRSSHHVDKEPLVGEWRNGIALILNRVELAYSHIVRTREFEGQPHNHIYGSLSLSLKF